MIKPKKLTRGDAVAVLSPSWGGPSRYPHIYESGIAALKQLGLRVKEYPTARMDWQRLYKHPELRAQDINRAFADKEVKAIIATIGGEDSVRILPYLDKKIIKANPKILMGYSDTTTLTTYCNQLGLITFNGPSVMGGFSQWHAQPKQFQEHVKNTLFTAAIQPYTPHAKYTEGYPAWKDIRNTGKLLPPKHTDGWHWLQGKGKAQGQLFGGCIEVLEFMKGTEFWPAQSFWDGKILFLETSEDKPPLHSIRYMLRNYGAQGVYERIRGILVGRAMYYSTKEKKELDAILKTVVGEEFGKPHLPIVSNMDFGHTDPQYIMPLGIKAEIDCKKKSFRLLEAPLR
jgi:muramoyltetrapeptide carboxypeptidase LdcA involved in peptidoglycan recycling